MQKVMVIGIAGGTGSGKTTITRRLMQRFGSDVCMISYDNYYKARHNTPFEERAKMYHWLYLDAAGVAEASERDKLHMEKEEHRKLAVAICSMIRAALPQKQG